MNASSSMSNHALQQKLATLQKRAFIAGVPLMALLLVSG